MVLFMIVERWERPARQKFQMIFGISGPGLIIQKKKKKKIRTFESLNCLGGANLDRVSRESEEAREV